MSVKYKVVLTLVICLFSKVFLTGCVVLFSVSRNITDSYRIGIHGCTRNSSICTSSSTCQPDGSCLCPATSPERKTFRSPIIGVKNCKTFNADHDSYGCHHDKLMIDSCKFSPFQVVPYSQGYPEIDFSYDGKSEHTVGNCSLRQTLVKFPDKTEEIEIKWLDESYVDLKISNNNIYFKWKKTVQNLQGTIIALNLNCTVNSKPTTECLRAKIFGKWSANMNSSVKENSTKPPTSGVRSNANETATQKTLVSTSPTGRMPVNVSDSSIIFTALDTSSIKNSSTKPSRSTTSYFWSNINKKTSQKTSVRSSPTVQMPRSDHESWKTTFTSDTSSINESSIKPSRSTTSYFMIWSKIDKKTSVRSSPTGQMPRTDLDSRKTTFASNTGSIKEFSTKPSRPTTSDARSKTNRKTSQKISVHPSPTVKMPSIDSDLNKATIVLYIVLPTVLLLIFILVGWLMCRRCKRNDRKLKKVSREKSGKNMDPRCEAPDINLNMKETSGDHSNPVNQDISDTSQTLVRHSNPDDPRVMVEANPIYEASDIKINQTPDVRKREIDGANFHSEPAYETADHRNWAEDEDGLDTTQTFSSGFNPDDESVIVMVNPIYEAP